MLCLTPWVLVLIGLGVDPSALGSARPDESCDPRQRAAWVSFHSPSPAVPADDESGVVIGSELWSAAFGHLRAELARHRVQLCRQPAAGGASPIGKVSFALMAERDDAVVVDIDDALTKKRLSRVVALDRVPPEGRALTVAVAAHELLRASWAELAWKTRADAIARERETNPSPPSQNDGAPQEDGASQDALAESLRRDLGDGLREELRSPLHVAVSVGAEHFTGGYQQAGADLFVGMRWTERGRWVLGGEAHGGLRFTPEEASQNGTVAARALTTGLRLRLGTSVTGSWRLMFLGGVDAMFVTFMGEAAPGAEDDEATGTTFIPQVGMGGSWSMTRALSLRAELTAGYPVRPLHALDDNQTVLEIAGPLVGLAIAVEVSL